MSSTTAGWLSGFLPLLAWLASIMIRAGSPALASTWLAACTLAASKLGAWPPRRITWQSGLPAVAAIAERPSLVTARKRCGCEAAITASAAMRTLPSVPFLNPTGHDSPEAISRWIWLSVVRAPIAPQATRSAMYCGEIVSRYSQPAGRPSALMSRSRVRPSCRPLLMSKLPSRSGSLISPFQPTVVRGFSKYTRITISSASPSASRNGRRRRAYSIAAAGSWIEHGPITTARRSSWPCRMRCRAPRASETVSDTWSVQGICAISCAGGTSASMRRMRRSSVWGAMGECSWVWGVPPGGWRQKSRQGRWRLSGWCPVGTFRTCATLPPPVAWESSTSDKRWRARCSPGH